MKRRRDRIRSNDNNRRYERHEAGGCFGLPLKLLFNAVDCVDNATMYVYLALASCHYEGHTTCAGSDIARLTGKDECTVRLHLADLEILGLIRREPLGRAYRTLFECPDRERIRQGAQAIAARKQERLQ